MRNNQRFIAAIGCSAAVLGASLVLACGPQRVPLPSEPRSNAGRTAPEGGNGGGVSAGRGGGSGGSRPVGGSSGRAGSAAEGGSSSQPQGGGGGSGGGGLPFDAGSDPNRNNVQAGMLCARLAVIQCAAEAHCCFAPGRSGETCESEIRDTCNDELFLDTIAANAITGFDAAAAAAAYTELEDRSARCDLEIASWGLTALRSILKGTYNPNQSCKPPGTSAINNKPAQAAALASCKQIEEYACLPMSLLGDWTCAPKSASGGNCVTDDNCQTGLFCRNPNMQLLGKCAERLALGATCTSGTECGSFYCKAGKCVAAEQQVAFCLAE